MIRSYFVVNGVKFGQHDPVDEPWTESWNGMVRECLIELGQLIDSLVAHQRFSNKQNQIRTVHFNQLK